MENLPLILLFFILLVFITRSFTTLIHELGHAIPALLLTRESVSIYIGSYGDPKKSLHLKFGLLVIWFKYNPFSWRLGLCVPSAKQIPIYKQIIFTLTGPFSSLLIAIFAYYIRFIYDLHGFINLILIVFLISSIFDLFSNLIPNKIPIQLYDGRLVYNDGYKLKQLIYFRKFAKEYYQAVELYNEQNFKEAAILFMSILKSGIKDEIIYRLTINSLFQIRDFNLANDISNEFLLNGKLNSDDYANLALSYSHLAQFNIALEFYDKSLLLNPNNKFSLINKGFTLILLDKYQEAIPLFDKAIEIDKTFSYSYNNRGLAKIKLGKTEEGLEDMNISFKLNENDSYYFRNLGIYHLDRGEYSKALELFIKAKEHDDTTYKIDELINKANRH